MLGAHSRKTVGTCAGLFFFGVLTSACSSSKPAQTPSHSTALWGDLKPVVSVKELMRDMIDPASDNIFDAVGTVATKEGVVDIAPKTDADWEKLRIGAVTL